MLGDSEVVRRLEISWDELLNHGHEPFDLAFPHVRGVHPSIELKAATIHACDDQDDAPFDSLVDCKIARDTDAGHAQFTAYVTSKTVSHLNNAVEHFQLVLDQCLVSHPDYATALTNLAWVRLLGYIRNDLEDIDATTSLFRDALALRLQHHPDHPLSPYNLTEALTWHYIEKSTATDIREAAQLYHELLPLCPEDTYLPNIAAGNGITHVIDECNDLPTDASMKASTFEESSPSSVLWAIISVPQPSTSLHHQGKSNDLNESISLHEEALRLCPVGHQYHDYSLKAFGHFHLPDASPSLFGMLELTEAMLKYVRRMSRALPHDQQSPQSPLRLSSGLYQTSTTHSYYTVPSFNFDVQPPILDSRQLAYTRALLSVPALMKPEKA